MTNDERKALIKKAAKAIWEESVMPGKKDQWGDEPEYVMDEYCNQARAALAVFEQAHTPTDDERMAAHKEAKKRYGRGEQQVRRRVAFEDGAAWAALHRPVQAEPTTYEPVINDGTDDAWQVIADALGNLGYDLNSHEETAAWVQQYLFRRPVQAEPTDAQVLAALNAKELSVRTRSGSAKHFTPAPDLSYYSEGNVTDMRAALRAAFQEGSIR